MPPDTDERGGEVIKGTLELLVLRTLQLGPMHGWGITEMIERWDRRGDRAGGGAAR